MSRDHRVRRVLPRDAIPSVDDPSFRSVAAWDEAAPRDRTDDGRAPTASGGELEPDAEVIETAFGDPRSYPIRYLHFHEVVNDVVPDGEGDRPVAVTWCPLCGSAVVYDRRVETPAGKRTLEFGVSGKLADDDLLMYDRETGSEWKQSLGRAIDGPLAGVELTALPAAVTTLGAFREANPDGLVMEPPGGESEAAGDGPEPEPVEYDARPYAEYFASEGFGLDAHRGGDGREWDRGDLPPKAVVLGVEAGDEALGFPLPAVEAAGGVVAAAVDDQPVVVFATDEGIHAFADPGFDWEPVADGFRGGGAVYDGTTGRRIRERDGAAPDELERLPAKRLFAFAWQDDHGREAFYEPD